MKILIVNASDNHGGAAKAATRLHQALLSDNVNSQMLVINKQSDDFTVLKFPQNFGRFKSRLRRLQLRFFNQITNYPNKTKTLFSTSFLKYSDIVRTINNLKPDVVHLHWICNEMIRIEDLAKIKAPVVWSLHDMWAFTGGCHYDEECGRYASNCGKCKVLGSTVENDLSKSVFRRKQKTFLKKSDITIIGLSSWLSSCAAKSTLLKGKKIVTLPNPIDSERFKPLDKGLARKVYSFPDDKRLILFGAMGATSDPRKGFHLLQEAINKIESQNLELVVFGSSEPACPPRLKFKTHYMGNLGDDVSLQVLYSACDVMVVPSLQENLSNAIMESLSCGTPVVGFSIGGNGDLIDHKRNGYLAQPSDIKDLAYGIEWVLEADNYDELCDNARYKVLQEFAVSLVVKKYVQLYREALM